MIVNAAQKIKYTYVFFFILNSFRIPYFTTSYAVVRTVRTYVNRQIPKGPQPQPVGP